MKHPKSSSTQGDLYAYFHQTVGKIKILDQNLLPCQLLSWLQYKKLREDSQIDFATGNVFLHVSLRHVKLGLGLGE